MFLTGFDAPTLNTLFVDKNTLSRFNSKPFHEQIEFMMQQNLWQHYLHSVI